MYTTHYPNHVTINRENAIYRYIYWDIPNLSDSYDNRVQIALTIDEKNGETLKARRYPVQKKNMQIYILLDLDPLCTKASHVFTQWRRRF